MNSVTEKTVTVDGKNITFNETTNGDECYRLIHNGISVIAYNLSTGFTATKNPLFVGTKEECDAELERLGIEYVESIDEDTLPEE